MSKQVGILEYHEVGANVKQYTVTVETAKVF